MKARSLVFDLYGDYLRYSGGEARLRHLVALLGAFDIPEATTRVTVARLKREGWLFSRREGRETVYSLTEAAWDLLDEGRDRIFQRAQGPWDGKWHMVIYSVPEAERALREQLRKKLAWFGFGALAPSVWISPHDRTRDVTSAFAGDPAARLDTFHSRSDGILVDRDLAGRAWDLAELDSDYGIWLDQVEPRLDRLRSGEVTGRDALTERMQLVHDYRLFPFRDPDLPPELLPVGWRGRRAHEVFLEIHGLLREAAESHVAEVVRSTRSDGPAPAGAPAAEAG